MTRPGQRGHCKICASRWLPDVNRQLNEKWTAREIGTWLQEASKGVFTVQRGTVYSHRDNLGGLHKRDTLALSPKAQMPRDPGPISRADAPKSSNDEFLEFVRDHGMVDLRENPEQITPKMAMEAVKILEARKVAQTNVLVLARVLTNQIEAPAASNPEIVVGEYREIAAPPELIGIAMTTEKEPRSSDHE